ncbi:MULTISPECIES: PIG-L deacetylase family protein [unclassified Sphingomonas]|uniref:PIG-L deacetylase family protein n=1 Tax=unclassified Sphingomonas TaxID=196159 RepID=UPI000AFB54EB|nr:MULTISPECIES: PIG-L deacetylase family protein [unclassified Sphingomonas]
MKGTTDEIRRVLVIAPHPDDEVLGCGGTMMRLADAGAEVHVAIITRAGVDRFGPHMAEIGRGEARLAHDLLGVTQTHFLDFPAAELDTVPHAEINAALGAVMTAVAPDTLFIPFLGDIHLDHQLVFLSSMVAARPRGGNGPARVYSYETLSETNWYAPGVTPTFAPNVFIDISDTIEAKLAAFRCYRSQVKAAPDERSPEVIRALATLRGATVHIAAAEAFILLRQIF